jgi:acyl-CoA thioester hydrolase
LGKWHRQKLRVRFEETDMMGVVYYAKFLTWFEVGRISLLRDIGLGYKDWVKRGFHIPVVQAHADYRASARLDDEVLVKTRVESIGRSSIRFGNEVYRLPDRELLCTGHTVHALIGEDGKATPFPPDLRKALTSS